MNEELLHYIWRYQRFVGALFTIDDSEIEIVFPGIYNTDAGPDFLEAKVRIGETLWVGNIEVHKKASDWYLHSHHMDKAYDNVILHVVLENDKAVLDQHGNQLQTLVIMNAIDDDLVNNYQNFMENKNWIACSKLIRTVDEFIVSNWFEALLIERLQHKVGEISDKLNLYKNDWQQVFYETIARNFGFNLFAGAFEALAKSLPISCIAKHKNNLFQLEALLFGQAGFLDPDFTDDYPNNLKSEYAYLQKKFALTPIENHLWKFLRNRPNNFPTIRIAQFAYLLNTSSSLFSRIIDAETLQSLRSLFGVSCSAYWENHYTFDVLSTQRKKKLGRSAIDLILINTVIPLLFSYGKQKNDQQYVDKAIDLMEQLPAEKNHIVAKFKEYGVNIENAKHSQGVLQLYLYYCVNKSCIRCCIGNQILNPKPKE